MAAIGRWLWRWFRPLAFAAAALALCYALWAQREAVSAVPWQLSWLAFAVAAAAFACGPVLGATGYWLLLRDLTHRAPYVASVRTWTRSFVARYVPSGALTVAVRVRARGDAAASTAQVLSATAFEQLAATLGGAAVATAAFLLAHVAPPLAAPAILAGAVAVALALRSGFVGRRLPRLEPVRGRALAGAALLAAVSWLSAGTAAWVLVAAITPGAPEPFFLVAAYAFAWLVGFLVVLAPGGLGVREATLIALLAPEFGLARATVIAVVLRFANIVGDLVAAGAVELGASLLGPPLAMPCAICDDGSRVTRQ
jgi:glycosyltransferase 2 family protein